MRPFGAALKYQTSIWCDKPFQLRPGRDEHLNGTQGKPLQKWIRSSILAWKETFHSFETANLKHMKLFPEKRIGITCHALKMLEILAVHDGIQDFINKTEYWVLSWV